MESPLLRNVTIDIAGQLILRLGDTLKIQRVSASRPEGNVIYAFFHGRQFALVYDFRQTDTAILTSLSRDGEFQNSLLQNLGYRTVRGSSTRGGVRGLVGLLREVKAGHSAAFAVDGANRGPRGIVKPGVIYLAAKSGIPIIPLAVSYGSSHVFRKAWDKYRLPHPFSRVALIEDAPFHVPENPNIPEQCSRLRQRLIELHRKADHIL